jgi:5-methylcytosine-specific restriction endonuclease McrA
MSLIMRKKRPKNKQEISDVSGVKPKRKPRAKRADLVAKPYNNGTMTSSAFFSFIRASLRRRTIVWKPIQSCKQKAKREYVGPNKRQRVEFQCNSCKNYFSDKEVSVDHVIPAGSLNSFEDLPGFVQRLFCEEEGLQVLCNNCHDNKSKIDKNETGKRRAEKANPRGEIHTR